MMEQRINAMSLFLQQRRFDLIFKYLYVKNPCEFNKEAYFENIRAFNGFQEISSGDVQKRNAKDFMETFDFLIDDISKRGFDPSLGKIPVSRDGGVIDGAHRLSICAAKDYDIEIEERNLCANWDYSFFRERGMDENLMDYGALEYVKLNPNAYIVNLMPITSPQDDHQVLAILEKYGFVYYKKDVWITFNGLVNIKKISYGSFWEKASWIGTPENKFAGAQNHARHSMGKNPLRALVFVCDSLANVVEAKKEIREIYGIENFSCHINDTHDEAVQLAESYFNSNTLFLINTHPFHLVDSIFEEHINELKTECETRGLNIERVCGAGSTPMNVFQIRHSQDLDCLSLDEGVLPENEVISSHNKYYEIYPYSIEEIINTPLYYMYYKGVKFISLDVLYQMKRRRCEIPKDVCDWKRIKNILRYQRIVEKIKQSRINRLGATNIQMKFVSCLYQINRKLKPLFIRQKMWVVKQKIKAIISVRFHS